METGGVVHFFASFFCITESGDKERSPEVTVCYIRRAKEVVTWWGQRVYPEILSQRGSPSVQGKS